MFIEKHLFMNQDAGDSGGGGAEAAAEPTPDRGDNLEPAAPAATTTATDPTSEALKKELNIKPEVKADDKPAEGSEKTTEDDKEKEADDPKAKSSRIPLDRHEKILAKERERRIEAERQLAQAQQGSRAAEVTTELATIEADILKMEESYAAMLADGEIKKATAIMSDIRKAEREMADARADIKLANSEARLQERTRYDVTLERIEATHAKLNPDHDEFDPEMLSEVADLKSAYELRGLTPTAALQKAVDLLTRTTSAAPAAAPAVAPAVAASQAPEKNTAAERKAAAVTKTVEAVSKTPPSANRVGLDSDKLGGDLSAGDVLKMSQSDFAKLSESALSKLRGDEI